MNTVSKFPLAVVVMVGLALTGIVVVSILSHDIVIIAQTATVLSALIVGILDRHFKQADTVHKIEENTALTKRTEAKVDENTSLTTEAKSTVEEIAKAVKGDSP